MPVTHEHTISIYLPCILSCMQGMRYDEEAELISMWLPELAAASTQHKHMPWDMQPEEKLCCETASGMQYPEPMVDPATQIGKLPKKQAAAAAAAACGEGGSGKRQGAKERRRGKRDSHYTPLPPSARL